MAQHRSSAPRSWFSFVSRLFSGRPSPRRPYRCRPSLTVLEDRVVLSAYVVTSTADDGSSGTLRAAVNAVNSGSATEIDFAIGQPGSAATISLTSALPALVNPVTINGYTQGGASYSGPPLITLTGVGLPANTIGLDLEGAGSILEGMTINGFSGVGVVLGQAGGDEVMGCYIGTDSSGTQAVANHNGIEVRGSDNTIGGVSAGQVSVAVGPQGSGNTVGGALTGPGNLISGNSNEGILIDSGANDNVVEGNFVGTDVTGTLAVANGLFVEIQGPNGLQPTYVGGGIEVASNNNTIGGVTTGMRNIISGNFNSALQIDGGTSGNLVENNYLGTDRTGTKLLGNTFDISDAGNNDTISFNLVDGSAFGLDIGSANTKLPGDTVQGNIIGLDVTGTVALSNHIGVFLTGANNVVGGTTAAARNVIASNQGEVWIEGAGATGNVLEGNYIGTNASGSAVVLNTSFGVLIEGGASSNIVGGTVTGAGNVIVGSTGSSLFDFAENTGVLIESDNSQEAATTGNVVEGNYIGLDATGTTALANNIGVEITGPNASGNTVGGITAGARNIISGNLEQGVVLGASAAANLVEENYIGTDAKGINAVANAIGIEILGNNGGNDTINANLVAGNTGDGVLLDSGTTGNLIESNNIGAAAANGGDGLDVAANSTTIIYNTVYGNLGDGVALVGSATGDVVENNVIVNNALDGVFLDSGTSANNVQGNFIGLDTNSFADGNGANGVEVLGTGNTIGGTAGPAGLNPYATGNVISGNALDGVLLGVGASGNLVLGNFIGTDQFGTTAVGNGGNGVEVLNGGNTVGGTRGTIGSTAGFSGNLISGNDGNGVQLDAAGSVVIGNYIGTDVHGKLAVANGGNGVEITASNVILGGTSSGMRNVISGNALNGVAIDAGTSGVQVEGNYIGTDVTGKVALGNDGDGAAVAGSSAVIGGLTAGARNVISGNSMAGVFLDTSSSAVLVEDNYVGTDVTGAVALANGVGVEVAGSNDVVGGLSAAADNLISGNSIDGILIDSTASGTLVEGNRIGTDATGSKAVANGNGVEVAGSSNTIGGTTASARNVISGNSGNGVLLDASASADRVQGNYIGTDTTGAHVLGNGGNGVEVLGSGNTIGGSQSGAGNTIAYNKQAGVLVSSGTGDTISRNSIFSNGPKPGGPGIVLAAGGNASQAAPVLKSATYSASTHTLTIAGTVTGAVGSVVTLEFYASPAGDPEGKVYLGSVTVTIGKNGSANFTVPITISNSAFSTTTTPLITADVTTSSGDTSAFSGGVTVK